RHAVAPLQHRRASRFPSEIAVPLCRLAQRDAAQRDSKASFEYIKTKARMDAVTAPSTHLDAPAAIRAAGLRVTESRRAVLEALHSGAHASADEVFARVQPLLPGTSVQSVYNALGDFAAAGLVRRIEPAGHPMLFELRVDVHHHHLVCTRCGDVTDVDSATGHAPCLTPIDAQASHVIPPEVTSSGLSTRCAAAAF